MPALARDPNVSREEQAALGRLLLRMDPAQLADYLGTLDATDLAIAHDVHQRALADQRQVGWRTDPYTMAHHLEGNGFDDYRHSQYLAQQFRKAVTGEEPRQIWNLPAQLGKGLALDTPILTPTGWTTMGALQVGDRVFGGDGRPCTVTGAHAVRWLDCYRLDFHDGATLIADGDHLWKVWDADRAEPATLRKPGRPAAGASAQARRAGQERGSWRVVTTRDLASAQPRRYRLPASPALLTDERPLPIDPYALGVWLGDGTSASAGLTCADDEILEHLAAVGEPARRCVTSPDRPYACTFAGTRTAKATFVPRLRALGVLGDKHVPDMYLLAGEKQRLALLQGLMDTDGSISRLPHGYSGCEFTSTSERLARGVQFLARSLGIRAAIHEGRATIDGRDCGPKWRVTFTTDLPVFRLSRKAARLYDCPGPRRGVTRVGVRSITSVPTVATRCITVDSPDSTYLAGDHLTVTHNTAVIRRGIAWALDRDPTLPIILTSYGAELALNSARFVRDYGRLHATDLRYRLREDATKVGEWLTTEGGGLKATGIQGALSGFPAGGLVIDDPHKNWQEAHSISEQEAVWDVYRSVLRLRLSQTGWMIIVHTRWCEGDLTDRVLKDSLQTGERWHHVRLPMLAEAPDPENGIEPDPLGREPGEPLEPRRYDLAACQARAAAIGSYLTAGMEQQRPSKREGGVLKRAWWHVTADVPERCDEWLTSWDMKLKDVALKGDFVVGQVWGRTGGDFWCFDQFRGQWSQGTVKAAIALCQVRYPQVRRHIIENTGNGPEVMAELRAGDPHWALSDAMAGELGILEHERELVVQVMRRGMSGLVPNNPKGDKRVRTLAVSGILEAGNCHLRDAPFAYVLVDEAANFPMPGVADDCVDAWSQAIAILSRTPGTTTVVSAAGTSIGRPRPGQQVPARMSIGPMRSRNGHG